MKTLKNWIQYMRNRWKYQDYSLQEEDFEIFDFDHVPYIDEGLRKGL